MEENEQMEVRPISIKEASEMMRMPEQFVRMSIFAGKIPGAFYRKKEGAKRGQYFITNVQVQRVMEGKNDGCDFNAGSNRDLFWNNCGSDLGHDGRVQT
jgi:hypothetical protein